MSVKTQKARHKQVCLNVGCGKHPMPEFTNLDQTPGPGVDVVFDLEKCGETPLPFKDDTFEELYASHVFEHIRNVYPFMQELHRVAKPGALFALMTPYGSSDDAYENPTHIRQVFLSTYGYYSQPFYWREDYQFRGDWQPERIVLKLRRTMYSEDTPPEMIMADIMTKRNIVLEMIAFLRCVKPIREPKKELQVPPKLEFKLVQA